MFSWLPAGDNKKVPCYHFDVLVVVVRCACETWLVWKVGSSNPSRVKLMTYKIYTCHHLAWHVALIRQGKDWLEQCRDNVIVWDIGSWYWWFGVPVGHHYKVTMSVHCHQSARVQI